MSMSAEHAEELKNESAVVCCRTEEGTILSADNLEDPDIFPDMVDSGLLTIPEDNLKVGQVIGAKLLKTIDSLTPLTPAIVEGYKEIGGAEESKQEAPKSEEVVEVIEEQEVCSEDCGVASVEGGVLRIKIEEGKGINIELPL
ncbi:sugar transporter [Clostridium sporogenes]|uniref:Sugar transporter n=1 Tax=Clostridium botulinum TaxID=1491 RepID=A0A6M0T5S2_CLOBO|nr:MULTISPECIES: sugar transporter [Clostridium]EJP6470776.1 sugar transporter [Clostridium botulinum]KOR26370.1 sugar transporter [Clostridium sp. L74]NFA62112.1 sugar transporter [Clostridium botulinum]NFI75175.1 sugar transporter [Clostridium sporogenes]NFL73542.1 sugar transporter [Clostridium sporogenes]